MAWFQRPYVLLLGSLVAIIPAIAALPASPDVDVSESVRTDVVEKTESDRETGRTSSKERAIEKSKAASAPTRSGDALSENQDDVSGSSRPIIEAKAKDPQSGNKNVTTATPEYKSKRSYRYELIPQHVGHVGGAQLVVASRAQTIAQLQAALQAQASMQAQAAAQAQTGSTQPSAAESQRLAMIPPPATASR